MNARKRPFSAKHVVAIAALALIANAPAVHTEPIDQGEGWSVSLDQDGVVSLTAGDQEVRIRPAAADGTVADGFTQCAKEADHTFLLEFTAQGTPLELDIETLGRPMLCITPGDGAAGMVIEAPVAAGFLPGYRMEDVLYHPESFADLTRLCVPAENWFAGLLAGGDGMLACAWPEGGQTLDLSLDGDGDKRHITALKLGFEGKPLYLELMSAPGIWRREPLELEYLERDVKLDWHRPFDATYKTQLPLKGETTALRTYSMWNHRGKLWRPETGDTVWPFWRDGEDVFLSMTKKIPPRGVALIYPWTGHDLSLMAFIERTPVAGIVKHRTTRISIPGPPRGVPNVGYNACWGTYLLRRTLYKLGLQSREKAFLGEHAEFLAYFDCSIQLLHRYYYTFADEMQARLGQWLDSEKDPAMCAYLERMLEHANELEESHRRKMTRYGEDRPEAHIEHAARNCQRLKELMQTPGDEVFPECYELVDEFNRMGWDHNEATGTRFGALVRTWAQDAALGCADCPAAIHYAQEIRTHLREALRRAPKW